MQRPLSSYPLASGHLTKLASAGFETRDDLSGIGIAELSKELCISHAEALEILKTVTLLPHKAQVSLSPGPTAGGVSNFAKAPSGIHGISALDLLKAEQLQKYIVTFCAKFDSMLGGGIPLGKITEICGAPGVGKTQFGMQLAVDATIPEAFAGVGGEAVYIDTEGSFVVERVVDMATAAVRHLHTVASGSDDRELQEVAKLLSLETVLAAIHYFRCHDHLELVALVNILPEFISQHSNVKLVVVDSLACHFRHDFKDMGLRSRILSGLAQNLIKVATENDLAVVLTNQMTTKFSQKMSAQLVPALGESWGHSSTNRVVLYWSNGERHALLYKSPNRKEAIVPFRITREGVRDVLPEGCTPGEDPSVSEACSQLVSLTSSQVQALEDSQGCMDNDGPQNDDISHLFVEECNPTGGKYDKTGCTMSVGEQHVDLDPVSGANSNWQSTSSKRKSLGSDGGHIFSKKPRL